MLRSIRYGEADRILHLYTPHRGRVGAIAKGVRRTRSRFGGRLEPFFRLRLVLHEGRGDLLTVTQRRDGRLLRRGCASDGAALDAAARACDAVPRLFETASRTRRSSTCSATSSRCSTPTRRRAARANQLAFRLKLLLAAGFAPQLAACALLRRARAPQRLLGAAGGVVCARLRGVGASRSTRRRTRSWPPRSAGRWREAPAAPERALRQAERAIAETVEHHAARAAARAPRAG